MKHNTDRSAGGSAASLQSVQIAHADVLRIAKQFGYDPSMLWASLWCESNGTILHEGRPLLAFNPQIFQRLSAANIAGRQSWRTMSKAEISSQGFLPRYPFQDTNGMSLIAQSPLGYKICHGPYLSGSVARKGIYGRSLSARMDIEYGMIEFLSHPALIEMAHQSLAMGPTQIMGFNHHILGLPSAQSMLQQFHNPVRAIELVCIFYAGYTGLRNGKSVADCLRTGDIDTFAALYGGDASGGYAAKLRKARLLWPTGR